MIETVERVDSLGAEISDRFTNASKRLLVLAQEQAQKFNHNYIGSEHLLLGAISVDAEPLRTTFGDADVTIGRARSATEFIIGRGDRVVVGEISLTPKAKKCIGLAVEAANHNGSKPIGIEHILYGILEDDNGIATGILQALGVNTEKLKGNLKQLLSAPKAETQAPLSLSEATAVRLLKMLSDESIPKEQRFELFALVNAAMVAIQRRQIGNVSNPGSKF
ncbi:MAG: Clp protease N-terminal domain-containing protein [bacterium]|nr:Clp protease N-terminal domain-containing protein [bacterium]